MLDLIVQKASYLGIIAFLALCGLGLPVPEEAPLILAGVLSANGTLDHPSLAYASCLFGALLGDSIMYFIGRRLGHGYLRQHPKFARFVDPQKEEKFERAVTDHGFKLVLLTRFLIGVRGPVYFAAGAARVPYWRFFLWDLVAASIVVSVVFGLGYYYGEQISGWVKKTEYALTAIVILVGLGVAGYLGYRRYNRRVYQTIDRLAEESDAKQKAVQNVPDPNGNQAINKNGQPSSSSQDDESRKEMSA